MALTFANSTGEAQKTRGDGYKYKDGKNTVRMVGDLLARYVYWIKGENDKPLPIECLSFDRDAEKFTNVEKDWVKEFYPDLKCGWAYAIQIIDPEDGKVKILNLKKKLMGNIIDLAKDLGVDPTDPETGFDVIFEKKKTGPLPINVEYKLKEREIKSRALTAEEKEAIAELKSMDTVMPRPTAEQQKALLEKLNLGSTENIDEDVGTEFEVK